MVKPSASKAYIMPSASPLTICWRKMSSEPMADGSPARRGWRDGPGQRALLPGGDGDVLDLAVPPLVDRNGPRQDVAVRIERDWALERRELGGLDGVPQVRPVDRLAALRRPLDGVGDHVDGVIGRDGI